MKRTRLMNENELTKPSWDCSFWPTVDAQLFIVSHLRKTTFHIIVLTVHFPAVSSLVHWQEDNRSPRQPILIGYKEKELFSSINIKYFAEKTKWKKKCSWVTPKPLCLRYVNGLCDHKNRSQKTFQMGWNAGNLVNLCVVEQHRYLCSRDNGSTCV